jgi:hypothetical protein
MSMTTTKIRVRVALAATVVAGTFAVATIASAGGQSELAAARQATAAYHQVDHAEADGYVSTIDDLGCFENPGVGGMGLHYLRPDLLDDQVSPTEPEALVYEMRDNGMLKLVALEYIVPVDAWTDEHPPMLFGQHFHEHPVLPLWVLHAWVWEPNPAGMFEDWNPRVGDCPAGVPVFGS